MTPAEFNNILDGDGLARNVGYLWNRFNTQRTSWIQEKKELRDYVFATDTSTTANSGLPWKNSTTLPKLCQIRDNLHSNYLSAAFPNDNWLTWEAYRLDEDTVQKARAIEAYMDNKTRERAFRTEMSKCLLDYIDYGNAFAMDTFEDLQREQPDGSFVQAYVGPRAHRISPLDIVFNPLAASFDDSFKIVRSIKTIGELRAMAEDNPGNQHLQEYLQRRELIVKNIGSFSTEDQDKNQGYYADGFGSLTEYYQSNTVEILEFWGDIHDNTEDLFLRNHVVTVVDRSHVIRKEKIESWTGKAPIYHAGWRKRPDNLWSMGPLDNLVGLQYRIDHLENLKADAMDLSVHPPLKIKGDVDPFEWGPNTRILLEEDGDVSELGQNLSGVINASNEIQLLENKMEMYAGAPREAMGVRTAGEKTAFEVQQLQNAAGRIFQEKTNSFEIELLEPLLNGMLARARMSMSQADVVRVMDDDLAVTRFMEITKEDISAAGVLRPVGARHFAQQAQMVQNINMLLNSGATQLVAPHMSGKALARLMEGALDLDRYQLFAPNVGVEEAAETQRLSAQIQEDIAVEQATPTEGESV